MTDRVARLVLVRHGETVGNREKLWTGWTDTPLSEAGRRQVQRTADWLVEHPLQPKVLYSSPIGRAWTTATVIGQAIGLSPIAHDALKEMHFGELEAIRSEHFESDHPLIYSRWRDRTDESFGWPGGETRRAFRTRVAGVMEQLAAQHAGETILLVVHSGVIRMALAHLAPDPFVEWWRYSPENCSLTHLLLGSNGRAEVPMFNQITHLAD